MRSSLPPQYPISEHIHGRYSYDHRTNISTSIFTTIFVQERGITKKSYVVMIPPDALFPCSVETCHYDIAMAKNEQHAFTSEPVNARYVQKPTLEISQGKSPEDSTRGPCAEITWTADDFCNFLDCSSKPRGSAVVDCNCVLYKAPPFSYCAVSYGAF